MGYQDETADGERITATPEQYSVQSLLRGVFYGVVGYVTSFLLIAGFFFIEMLSKQAEMQESVEFVTGAGWLFYGAHQVEITYPLSAEPVNFLETIYYPMLTSPLVPKLAMYGVPVVILLVLGYELGRQSSADSAALTDAAVAGGSLAAGYLLLSVLGGTTIFVDSAAAIKPELGSVVLFMGLVYPFLLGSASFYAGAS